MKQNETRMKRSIELLSGWLQTVSPIQVITRFAELSDDIALFIVDSKQQIILWNSGAEKLLGLNQIDVLGKLCPEPYRVIFTAEKRQLDREITRTDGQTLVLRQSTQALYDELGQFAGGVCQLQQIQASSLPAQEQRGQALLQNFQGILSRAPQMRPVFQIIQSAAKTEATVLVRGESGTGKELVARAIHNLSSRSKQPFLAINCAALSANLLESELFGHVRGAFSGAIKDHAGLFSQANGGTLFLDEVAELPLELQAKLLRVLQEREYIPVGGTQSYSVDVRIVAATHRSLREEVRAERFREDLMYRLRVVPIFIPPLRERREDIPVLLMHFIKQHNQQGLRQIDRIDPLAMRVLLDYQWPGNIRELQNVLEYAFVVGSGDVLHLSELPPEFREQTATQIVVNETLTQEAPIYDEKLAIEQALNQANGKVNRAAELLGMSRATFWRKRKQYGI